MLGDGGNDYLNGNGGTDTLAGNDGNDGYAASEQASEIDDDYLPPDYPFDFEDRDNLIDPVI